MKITLSAHAKVKMKERKLSVRILAKVLAAPRLEYYDIGSGTRIAIAQVPQIEETVDLVVIYRRSNDSFHVVTAYPARDVNKEIQRKLKGGRWIPTSTEGYL